jgi:hypothetical protein
MSNPSAYISDGNTLWNNIYGFITNTVNDLVNYFTKTEVVAMINGNVSALDTLKLNKTDQRYNDTAYIDGIVTANEIEISVKFKGLGRLTNGGDEIYPMERVKAVGFKEPGFTRGHIQFGVLDAHGRAEANSTNSGFIFGSIEHMVMFEKKSLKDFIALKEFVELQINMNKTKKVNNSHSQLSIADELEKLAKLKESGVLTDAEFQSQKQKLIG